MTAIQRISTFAYLCLAISLAASISQADDNLGYVLAPLRTELHRSEISSKASAFLILNANALKADQEDLLGAIRTPLENDLRTLSAKMDTQLLIRIQYSGEKKLEKEEIARLKMQLKELATKCGYRESQLTEEWTSTEWQLGTGMLGSGLMDDPGEENLIVNKTLIAAPVRTRISKLRSRMADALIKLRRPIDARNLEISDQTKDAIRSAIKSMKLSSKRQLFFDISSTKAGANAVETLFSNRQPPAIPDDAPPAIKELLRKESENFKISPALTLARELGFDELGYRHSSNGGAPERLLDIEAPSFELRGLNGDLIKWPEWRGDKPALLTFWGVACGPCRLEAPHLSRLHEKHGADIAILGINAYDETNENVQAYVTKEKLKHQIVVGGKDLADTEYQVGAYPTTFWIDRHGKVVRYVVGFENGAELEAELIEFIAEQKR